MLAKLKTSIISPLTVHDTLQEKRVTLFTPNEFSRVFKVPMRKTRYFLEMYTKRGLLVRLRNGLYALKEMVPNEEVIANALYQPSYISLEYALSRYGIIPEMPYTITSVTPKITATFTARGKDFSYQKIKKNAFTGYVPEKVGDHTIFIATPEKALVDYLYFVSLGKRTLNDRFSIGRLDHKKIMLYGKRYARPQLDALITAVLTPKKT
jgi:predicted transcriptional regulator of viral defense system